jgi:hypothetical protein
MATNGGVVNGTDNSLKDLITSSKKDKFQTLTLSHEIISGVSRQITGIDNELSTVARMQQFKSYSVSNFYLNQINSPLSFVCSSSVPDRIRRVMRAHKER